MVGREALKEEFVPASSSGVAHNPCSAFDNIDVVAVQGLASNYETTWTAYDENERPCMWLRDLLPLDLPAARIQTFIYDSRWYDDPDYVSLRECGKRLLYALLADRTHRNQRSFGGLVIKQCLVIASQVKPDDGDFCHEDCQDLLKAVAGITYLGVPHRGSNFAKWGLRKSWLGGLRGKRSYPANLKALAIESTTLEELREDFTKLAQSRTLSGIELFCFYETKGIQLGIVVEQPSACLDFAPFDSLAANHFEMNKFLPGENYSRLLKRLQDFCASAPSIVKQRYEWETYASPQACPEYQRIETFLAAKADLQSQTLDQFISRRDPDTCKWTGEHEDRDRRFNELKGWTEVVEVLSKFRSNKAIRVLYIGHPNDQPIGSSLKMVKEDNMAFDISQYTKEDIKIFVHKKVNHYHRKWPNQEAFGGEIEQFLLGNSQGMYQWVSLVLDVIDRYGESTDEARRALVDFPTGLQAM
ncbi:MAG: hypothetical protein Q9195_006718 [Heterodermia aff. obscurata]